MSVTRVCMTAVMGGIIVAGTTLVQGQGAAPAAPATAAQPAAQGNRPPAPTRDPRTPGYVTATNATELPDGAVPPVNAYGNFILGPTHPPAPEMTVQDGVPQRHRPQLHDELGRQQDLSRHRTHAGHPCGGRSGRSREADREQRPCSVHADASRYMSRSNTSRAPSPPSSSAPTDPISCCSRRWTI